ncbi:hypothetical protein HDV00_012127 [Rhizophlyctis rosea]|nr:hypothetical protein HDV00_012127 [Rhizophlyctis rosea]
MSTALSKPWLLECLLRDLTAARQKAEGCENSKNLPAVGRDAGTDGNNVDKDEEARPNALFDLQDEKKSKRVRVLQFLTAKIGDNPSPIEVYESNPGSVPITSLRGGVINLKNYKVQLHPEGNDVSVHLVIEAFNSIGAEGCSSEPTKSVADEFEVRTKIDEFLSSLRRYPSQDTDSWGEWDMLLDALSGKSRDNGSESLYELTDADCNIPKSQAQLLATITPDRLKRRNTASPFTSPLYSNRRSHSFGGMVRADTPQSPIRSRWIPELEEKANVPVSPSKSLPALPLPLSQSSDEGRDNEDLQHQQEQEPKTATPEIPSYGDSIFDSQLDFEDIIDTADDDHIEPASDVQLSSSADSEPPVFHTVEPTIATQQYSLPAGLAGGHPYNSSLQRDGDEAATTQTQEAEGGFLTQFPGGTLHSFTSAESQSDLSYFTPTSDPSQLETQMPGVGESLEGGDEEGEQSVAEAEEERLDDDEKEDDLYTQAPLERNESFWSEPADGWSTPPASHSQQEVDDKTSSSALNDSVLRTLQRPQREEDSSSSGPSSARKVFAMIGKIAGRVGRAVGVELPGRGEEGDGEEEEEDADRDRADMDVDGGHDASVGQVGMVRGEEVRESEEDERVEEAREKEDEEEEAEDQEEELQGDEPDGQGEEVISGTPLSQDGVMTQNIDVASHAAEEVTADGRADARQSSFLPNATNGRPTSPSETDRSRFASRARSATPTTSLPASLTTTPIASQQSSPIHTQIYVESEESSQGESQYPLPGGLLEHVYRADREFGERRGREEEGGSEGDEGVNGGEEVEEDGSLRNSRSYAPSPASVKLAVYDVGDEDDDEEEEEEEDGVMTQIDETDRRGGEDGGDVVIRDEEKAIANGAGTGAEAEDKEEEEEDERMGREYETNAYTPGARRMDVDDHAIDAPNRRHVISPTSPAGQNSIVEDSIEQHEAALAQQLGPGRTPGRGRPGGMALEEGDEDLEVSGNRVRSGTVAEEDLGVEESERFALSLSVSVSEGGAGTQEESGAGGEKGSGSGGGGVARILEKEMRAVGLSLEDLEDEEDKNAKSGDEVVGVVEDDATRPSVPASAEPVPVASEVRNAPTAPAVPIPAIATTSTAAAPHADEQPRRPKGMVPIILVEPRIRPSTPVRKKPTKQNTRRLMTPSEKVQAEMAAMEGPSREVSPVVESTASRRDVVDADERGGWAQTPGRTKRGKTYRSPRAPSVGVAVKGGDVSRDTVIPDSEEEDVGVGDDGVGGHDGAGGGEEERPRKKARRSVVNVEYIPRTEWGVGVEGSWLAVGNSGKVQGGVAKPERGDSGVGGLSPVKGRKRGRNDGGEEGKGKEAVGSDGRESEKEREVLVVETGVEMASRLVVMPKGLEKRRVKIPVIPRKGRASIGSWRDASFNLGNALIGAIGGSEGRAKENEGTPKAQDGDIPMATKATKRKTPLDEDGGTGAAPKLQPMARRPRAKRAKTVHESAVVSGRDGASSSGAKNGTAVEQKQGFILDPDLFDPEDGGSSSRGVVVQDSMPSGRVEGWE